MALPLRDIKRSRPPLADRLAVRPIAAATAMTDWPSASRRIVNIRPCGAVRAFPWLSIRGSELLGDGRAAATSNQLSPGGTTPSNDS
jgi:hypothetical protein